jgi:hypothetical protein
LHRADPASLPSKKRIVAAILDKADAIRRRRQETARLADTLNPQRVLRDVRGHADQSPVAAKGETRQNPEGI